MELKFNLVLYSDWSFIPHMSDSDDTIHDFIFDFTDTCELDGFHPNQSYESVIRVSPP